MTEPDNETADTTADDDQAQQLLADAVAAAQDQQQPEQPADAADGIEDDASDTAAKELERLKAEVSKWKTLSRKHESNAKANSSAATKLAELEDAQKTNEQRLNDKLAAAERELLEFRTAKVRNDAAREAGLPPELAEFITEVEPELALDQAQRLAEKFRANQPKPVKPDLKQGARPTARQADDPNAWIRRMAGRT